MSEKLRVGISEFRIGRAPLTLVTYGLGSCLAITLYDAKRQLGGLAHTLLPELRPNLAQQRLTKFVDQAIRLMAERLEGEGAVREDLEAKIVGGANMFEPLYPTAEMTIGERNAASARQILPQLGIPLTAEEVGGHHGRTVEFDLATGAVLVRSVRLGQITI